MLFNSWQFLLFLLVTIGLYYLPLFKNIQIHILILASFVFYGRFQPWLLTLLIFSILINAWSSFKVAKAKVHGTKVTWAIIGVVANLVVLLFFKYSVLIIPSIFGNWKGASAIGNLVLLIPLPIGISFFTFQKNGHLFRDDHF